MVFGGPGMPRFPVPLSGGKGDIVPVLIFIGFLLGVVVGIVVSALVLDKGPGKGDGWWWPGDDDERPVGPAPKGGGPERPIALDFHVPDHVPAHWIERREKVDA